MGEEKWNEHRRIKEDGAIKEWSRENELTRMPWFPITSSSSSEEGSSWLKTEIVKINKNEKNNTVRGMCLFKFSLKMI